MIPDPRDWSIGTALVNRDSTRMTRGEVAGFGRLVIRTDLPPAPRPARRRRASREQRIVNALAAVTALGLAAWLAFLLWGGAQLVHGLADAAARLVAGGA